MTLVYFALAIVATSSFNAQLSLAQAPPSDSAISVIAIRNPSFLHATEVPAHGSRGAGHHIRFAWEQVPASISYVLAGQWTDNQSWAVRSFEYRITDRNATSWTRERVTFDVSLPEGSHSWKLVAIFGPGDEGDFENPAHMSFNIR